MKTHLSALVVGLLAAAQVQAAVQTKAVDYQYKGVTLKGLLAWDDKTAGKRPGVMVVHEWWGLDNYAKDRARQLAEMGYVAFAADMYGEGKTTKHPDDAKNFATEVREKKEAWMGRALAGLKVLPENDMVDGNRLAAIGYCFGGSTVLNMAFSGAPLKAVVSFHGALPVPSEEDAKNTKAKILVCHGALDFFIKDETIKDFRTVLDKAQVDYQFVYYANAVHSFTVPDADKVGVKGLGYNAAADQRSWQHMEMLFKEVFAKK